MSILIPGKMPTNGEVMVITPNGQATLYARGDVAFIDDPKRIYKTIELPPLGRVIDVDEMERFMSDSVQGDIRSYPYGDETWGEAFRWMDSRPTIIPADREEDT